MPKALSMAVTGFAAGLGVTTALTFTLPGSNRGGMQATTLAVTKAMASNQFAEKRHPDTTARGVRSAQGTRETGNSVADRCG